MRRHRAHLVSEDTVFKYIKQLEGNKAVGHDGLSSKFIKLSGKPLAMPLCELFNRCVMSSQFPVDMILAEIIPVFKKKIESLFKENYRSVNVLTVISKIFERVLADQLMIHFDNLLSVHLSAYRKGYSCQHAILQLTEYWRRALDEGQNVGTIAMDLSKAFDKMPHALLIAKLHAYNVSPAACNFIISYLKNRLQRVKVQGVRSEWTTINRSRLTLDLATLINLATSLNLATAVPKFSNAYQVRFSGRFHALFNTYIIQNSWILVKTNTVLTIDQDNLKSRLYGFQNCRYK